MYVQLLDLVPLWGVFVGTFVLTLLGLEGGYRAGRWRHAHAEGESAGPIGAMVGAILGLLAFMLAFTFGLAASRFDARRMTILDEANAIGTTYLRTEFLPEPQRTNAATLLREYVDVRLAAANPGKISSGIARSEELQQQLWKQATQATEKNPSVITGLFVQSLNEMIDLHSTRLLIGARSRIPTTIWAALFALTFIGMASMGYQAGLTSTRRSPAVLLLASAFASVLWLIVDLDRPYEGLLNVSQQSMIDLQRSLNSPRAQ